MRDEVAKLVAQGKTREQSSTTYIAKYGSQEPLASPIDKGFNRLAWLFPYLMGGDRRDGAWRAGVPLVAARRGEPVTNRGAATPRQRASTRDWTMSSEISIESRPAPRSRPAGRRHQRPAAGADDGFRPWHFFVLASILLATVAVILARQSSPGAPDPDQPHDRGRRRGRRRASTGCWCR